MIFHEISVSKTNQAENQSVQISAIEFGKHSKDVCVYIYIHTHTQSKFCRQNQCLQALLIFGPPAVGKSTSSLEAGFSWRDKGHAVRTEDIDLWLYGTRGASIEVYKQHLWCCGCQAELSKLPCRNHSLRVFFSVPSILFC